VRRTGSVAIATLELPGEFDQTFHDDADSLCGRIIPSLIALNMR